MYDAILVPTDGNEHAERVAEHAAALAHAMDATIHAVAVVDVQSAAGPFSAGGVDRAFVERLEERAAADVERVVDLAEAAGVQGVETAVLEGTPGASILEYATDQGVDVIAMGTHGRTGLGRILTGSVTEHVLRRAEMPVLTCRATERSHPAGDYDDVLLPTDGSKCAGAAFDHGIEIAEAVGARVHAVSVVDPTALAASPDSGPTPEMVERFESARADAAESVAERARDAGLEAESTVREGTPARAILDYAEERDVDLIAMGTHGRTGPRRLVLGSTTERIVRRADVPVLTVRARGRSD